MSYTDDIETRLDDLEERVQELEDKDCVTYPGLFWAILIFAIFAIVGFWIGSR